MSSTKLEPSDPDQSVIRRTTTTTRKFPWLPLLLSAALIPLILTALATLTGLGPRDHIQEQLTDRSRAALQSAGLSDTDVSLDGREATLRNVPAGREDEASKVVGDVDGVRAVNIEGTDNAAATTAPAPTSASAPAPTPAPAPAPAAAPAPPAPAPPAAGFDKNALQQQINGAIAAQGLTFVPDTEELTGDGVATVAKVADALKAAPDAKVEIDGFVADLGGSEPAAKALSQQRAQQVKDQLVQAGIAEDRMTALGFGTERQIGSGLAANRRVEIIVL